MQGLTPSRPQIAEPALADDGQQLADDGQLLADDGQQLADDGHQSADDSMDSDDGEYEDNDGQSEVSEEEENGDNGEDDEDVLEPGADDEYLSADWGAQRPVENEFLSSQPSIITITPRLTQTSGGRVSYQERRTPPLPGLTYPCPSSCSGRTSPSKGGPATPSWPTGNSFTLLPHTTPTLHGSPHTPLWDWTSLSLEEFTK